MKDSSEIVKTINADRKNPFYLGMTITLFSMIALLVVIYLKGAAFLQSKDFVVIGIIFAVGIGLTYLLWFFGRKTEKQEESKAEALRLYDNAQKHIETNVCDNGYVYTVEKQGRQWIAKVTKDGVQIKSKEL